jgi:hypothetical protein
VIFLRPYPLHAHTTISPPSTAYSRKSRRDRREMRSRYQGGWGSGVVGIRTCSRSVERSCKACMRSARKSCCAYSCSLFVGPSPKNSLCRVRCAALRCLPGPRAIVFVLPRPLVLCPRDRPRPRTSNRPAPNPAPLRQHQTPDSLFVSLYRTQPTTSPYSALPNTHGRSLPTLPP